MYIPLPVRLFLKSIGNSYLRQLERSSPRESKKGVEKNVDILVRPMVTYLQAILWLVQYSFFFLFLKWNRAVLLDKLPKPSTVPSVLRGARRCRVPLAFYLSVLFV